MTNNCTNVQDIFEEIVEILTDRYVLIIFDADFRNNDSFIESLI